MSILGAKKKQVDTSLHKSINVLNLRVLNIENMVTAIKSKPDRKIITIYAGIDGPIRIDQKFAFGDGSGYYIMNFAAHILNISLISLRTNRDDVSAIIAINKGAFLDYGIKLNEESHSYVLFETPLKVKAGDVINFFSMIENKTTSNTLLSVIIEIFL